jgi:hypothetical protein
MKGPLSFLSVCALTALFGLALAPSANAERVWEEKAPRAQCYEEINDGRQDIKCPRRIGNDYWVGHPIFMGWSPEARTAETSTGRTCWAVTWRPDYSTPMTIGPFQWFVNNEPLRFPCP